MTRLREISDDEFGRCFEIGIADRDKGKPENTRRYKNEYRQLGYHDGWQAQDASATHTGEGE